MRRHIVAPRGLRELPDLGEANAASGGAWRLLWKCASRRRGTCVIDRPVDDLSPARALANIIGSHNIAVVGSRNTRAINARAKSSARNPIHPGVNVSLLFRQHSPALLLVEEDDSLRVEPFTAGGSDGNSRVRPPDARGVGNAFQFGIEASVEEHEEAEAGEFDSRAVSSPAVRSFARRIVKPI